METIKRLRSKIGVEIKAGFWYTVGNFFLKGVAFITIPIFTRLLTTSDYGLISLFTTWVGVFTIIGGLSLNSSVIRGYHDFKDDYARYLSSVMFLSLMSFLATVFLVTVFRSSLVSLIGFSYPIIVLILFQSYFTFLISFNNMKYISQYLYKKSLLISIGTTITGVIFSLILVVLVFTNNRYLGNIYGMLVPSAIIGSIILMRVLIKGKKMIDLNYWKYALGLSLPMIPHLLAHIILSQSDRVLINTYIGSDAVGIYSFAYNLGLISLVLLGSLNNAWVPWFYRKMDENAYTEIDSKTKLYMVFFSIMSIGLIFISPELVRIMAPIQYKEATWIIPIIVLTCFFQFHYTILINVQFYLKKNIFIPIGTVVAGLINIGLNIYFIPLYGYVAAVYTTLVSYIILFIMHFIVTKYLLKSNVYNFSFFIKPSIIVVALTMLFYLVAELIVIRYVLIIIIMGYIAIRYKRNILEFVK